MLLAQERVLARLTLISPRLETNAAWPSLCRVLSFYLDFVKIQIRQKINLGHKYDEHFSNSSLNHDAVFRN